MIIGVAVGIAILDTGISYEAGIIVLVVCYLTYLIGSIFCSEIRAYITNLKKFEEYKQTYDKWSLEEDILTFGSNVIIIKLYVQKMEQEEKRLSLTQQVKIIFPLNQQMKVVMLLGSLIS